jgi:hypothetical protein
VVLVGGEHASAAAFGRLLSALAICWRWCHYYFLRIFCGKLTVLLGKLGCTQPALSGPVDHVQFDHMLLIWLPNTNHGLDASCKSWGSKSFVTGLQQVRAACHAACTVCTAPFATSGHAYRVLPQYACMQK